MQSEELLKLFSNLKDFISRFQLCLSGPVAFPELEKLVNKWANNFPIDKVGISRVSNPVHLVCEKEPAGIYEIAVQADPPTFIIGSLGIALGPATSLDAPPEDEAGLWVSASPDIGSNVSRDDYEKEELQALSSADSQESLRQVCRAIATDLVMSTFLSTSAGSSKQTTKGQDTTSGLSTRKPGLSNHRKRAHQQDEDDDDEFSEPGKDGKGPGRDINYKRRRPCRKKLYACPYFRSNPNDPNLPYKCRTRGIKTHKLKEHIRRQHLKPAQCHRCGYRGEAGCVTAHEQKSCVPQDDFPVVDAETLHKDQLLGGGKQKWHEVHKILFPDHPLLLEKEQWFDEENENDRKSLVDSLTNFLVRALPELIHSSFPNSNEYKYIRSQGTESMMRALDPVGSIARLADMIPTAYFGFRAPAASPGFVSTPGYMTTPASISTPGLAIPGGSVSTPRNPHIVVTPAAPDIATPFGDNYEPAPIDSPNTPQYLSENTPQIDTPSSYMPAPSPTKISSSVPTPFAEATAHSVAASHDNVVDEATPSGTACSQSVSQSALQTAPFDFGGTPSMHVQGLRAREDSNVFSNNYPSYGIGSLDVGLGGEGVYPGIVGETVGDFPDFKTWENHCFQDFLGRLDVGLGEEVYPGIVGEAGGDFPDFKTWENHCFQDFLGRLPQGP